MRRRLLLVEDDATLRQALAFNLTREGYEVASAGDGESALEAARSERLDLILLDVMLPGMSGVEVLRVLRREGVTTPVIILSAKGDEIDRVVGLKVGADDYVAKPFSRPELLARIEAVLRRHRRQPDETERRELLEFGAVAIDVGRREVTVDGGPIHLTTKEFDLLAHMAASPGRIFTRDQLLARIWGYDYVGDGRTVDVHVSWLRGKLRGRDGHNFFRTVRGVGYAFAPPST
ncbi:MAG TPA: response regulator transcription factor [Candidatus Limnocylindrales bacterium]|jgi:two-component system, OmpR family, alkaline phosphatase synthesis response regulator PhoP|nr:response regulator transcription factor [Candidatus Limnocylindrales bacterium]